jgi:hypothetical protein
LDSGNHPFACEKHKDLFCVQLPVVNAEQALGNQFNPLPVFKAIKKISRDCPHAFACTKVCSAEKRDGVRVTPGVCRDGQEIGGIGISLD